MSQEGLEVRHRSYLTFLINLPFPFMSLQPLRTSSITVICETGVAKNTINEAVSLWRISLTTWCVFHSLCLITKRTETINGQLTSWFFCFSHWVKREVDLSSVLNRLSDAPAWRPLNKSTFTAKFIIVMSLFYHQRLWQNSVSGLPITNLTWVTLVLLL